MPFKSIKQKNWMFKNKPEMAKEWADKTPNMGTLPEKVETLESKAMYRVKKKRGLL